MPLVIDALDGLMRKHVQIYTAAQLDCRCLRYYTEHGEQYYHVGFYCLAAALLSQYKQ